jgi:hypothetical protein
MLSSDAGHLMVAVRPNFLRGCYVSRRRTVNAASLRRWTLLCLLGLGCQEYPSQDSHGSQTDSELLVESL